MDKAKQRIAIAEYCGWTNCRIGSPGAGGAVDRPGRPVGTPPVRQYTCELPNYTGCLNAMHEAEKTLTQEQWDEYEIDLGEVVWKDDMSFINTRKRTGATAAQRAEAFLRTIGKWEESK